MKPFIYCVAFVAILTSCKKENLLPENNNSQNPTMKTRSSGDVQFCLEASLVCEQNGVLIFPSLDAFQKVVEDIDRKHEQWSANGESEEAEYKISLRFEAMFSYSSLRKQIYNERELWLNNDELDINNDPSDKWTEGIGLRTVLNSNGAVKIGNIIYVCRAFGETFEIADGNFETMNLIIGGQRTGLTNTILHKADGSEVDASNGNVLKVADDCFAWRTKSDERTYNNNARKLKGKVWVHNLPFYANIGSESEHFKKKNNGGWKKHKADIITTQSSGTLYDRHCRTSGNISIGQTKNNKKQVSSSVTYWNQKTQSKNGQYGSYHYSKEGSHSVSFTIIL